MQEYVTEAVVLDRQDSGEQDCRVYLYTREAGKLSCKVKSVRKITSKLSGHLQPSNLVMARVVEKNGAQLVDALTLKTAQKTPALLKNLFLLKELAAEGQPDLALWNFLEDHLGGAKLLSDTKAMLAFMGFDPAFAQCNFCQKTEPQFFFASDFAFYCGPCAPDGAFKL